MLDSRGLVEVMNGLRSPTLFEARKRVPHLIPAFSLSAFR